MSTKWCPECGNKLGGHEVSPLWCPRCQYVFHDCEACLKIYMDEADATECCHEEANNA